MTCVNDGGNDRTRRRVKENEKRKHIFNEFLLHHTFFVERTREHCASFISYFIKLSKRVRLKRDVNDGNKET